MVIDRLRAFASHLARHINVASQVWRHRKQLDARRQTREEAEFLPEALALQETPPSPLPRVGAWVISSLIVVVFVYCVVAKVDIVVTADGSIVERTRSRIISATTTSKLLGFRVEEGDTVRAGDVLADLDEEFARAEVQRLEREFEDAKMEVVRADWILRSLDKAGQRIPIQDSGMSADRWKRNVDLMKGTFEAYSMDLARREAVVAQKRAELSTAREMENRMRAVLSLSREREGDLAKLAKEQVVSRHDALNSRQDLTDKEGELLTQQRRLLELEEAVSVLTKERSSAEAAIRKELLEARRSGSEKVAQLDKELVKARAILEGCHLDAPIDGTVQQLALQLVGGVAMPGNQIMVVVPLKRNLQVEAKVLNQDVGFLVPGMRTNIKVAAFPFTKYGTIPGRLLQISNDAVVDEKVGLVFTANASLERDVIRLENKSIRLSPGLQVAVEVRTGERRLIEYFLAPLLQKTSESFRER